MSAGGEMALSRRQRYHYYDTDPTELKLIRAGHAIWAILRRERRLKVLTASEEQALYDAIEIIVSLKKAYRAELAVRRLERAKKVSQYFLAKNAKS